MRLLAKKILLAADPIIHWLNMHACCPNYFPVIKTQVHDSSSHRGFLVTLQIKELK
jgi:hypothetical protein